MSQNNPNNNNNESSETNETKQKRLLIQQILKNPALSQQEKQHQIQSLMSGHVHIPTNTLTPQNTTCTHYVRQCNIISPCCGKIYACRLCHDDSEDHTLNRYEIREVVCNHCNVRQPASNQCVNPGCAVNKFAEYHCGVCNLWMDGEDVATKRPFHCDKCGLCRVGGRENFTHCDKCCMCIRNGITDHQCIKDKYKNICPVCREDMFSSRQSPIELACGHCIHDKCFRTLAQFDYRCPICKKTACDEVMMEEAWTSRARDIEMQPMPPNLSREVCIICNDCARKTRSLQWHFLGVQCPSCRSFNTSIVSNENSGVENNTATVGDSTNNNGQNGNGGASMST